MAELLFSLHGAVRYLVLLAGFITIIVAMVQLKAGTPGKPGRIAGAAFTGLLDLQVLLGLGVLLTRPFYPALIGHLTMMILAVAVAHGTGILVRRRPPGRDSAALQFGGYLIALALVFGGIGAIGRSIV